MSWYPAYVPVAKRKRDAEKLVAKLRKQGHVIEPIKDVGRAIASTFWGKAWCRHLESLSDFENRLPRGRTYVRNGSVIDLKMTSGAVTALVSGSSIYTVKITILPVIAEQWAILVEECGGKIGTMIELLQGKFSKSIMEVITHPLNGLFPLPKEIKMKCSCPDSATMCKHVAATLYGVGARLDERPQDLFLLRQADHLELLAKASATSLVQDIETESDDILADSDLSALFGIDMGEAKPVEVKAAKAKPKAKAKTKSKTKSKTTSKSITS